MKYFTDSLWSTINKGSEAERNQAWAEWDKNMQEYTPIFESIKPRLSKKFLKIYMKNHGFHDYRIKNMFLNHKEYGLKNPVSLEIYVTNDSKIYKITYKRIKKFCMDYNEKEGNDALKGMDDWGYDEFLPVDDQTLSHEILFASGAAILIHFMNGSVFIEKVE